VLYGVAKISGNGMKTCAARSSAGAVQNGGYKAALAKQAKKKVISTL
jgi:hypothetical protein